MKYSNFVHGEHVDGDSLRTQSAAGFWFTGPFSQFVVFHCYWRGPSPVSSHLQSFWRITFYTIWQFSHSTQLHPDDGGNTFYLNVDNAAHLDTVPTPKNRVNSNKKSSEDTSIANFPNAEYMLPIQNRSIPQTVDSDQHTLVQITLSLVSFILFCTD